MKSIRNGVKRGMSRLVRAATFLNVMEAHLFQDLLAAQGIESHIFDEQLQTWLRLPTMGVRVMVRQEDREQARTLLRELEAANHMPVRYRDPDF